MIQLRLPALVLWIIMDRMDIAVRLERQWQRYKGA